MQTDQKFSKCNPYHCDYGTLMFVNLNILSYLNNSIDIKTIDGSRGVGE